MKKYTFQDFPSFFQKIVIIYNKISIEVTTEYFYSPPKKKYFQGIKYLKNYFVNKLH